jgi:hypothetical protein
MINHTPFPAGVLGAAQIHGAIAPFEPSAASEFGRLPGMANVTMLVPMERLEKAGPSG